MIIHLKTTIMKNEMTFFFEAKDLKTLMDEKPDYVLISTRIEIGEIAGQKVGIFNVDATSFKDGEHPMSTIKGCPVPPCLPRFDKATNTCLDETYQMLNSYKAEDFNTNFKIQD